MRTEAKGYILKEYGPWSVLTVSYFIGIGVSRAFTWKAVPLFLALGLLINCKQAFTKWNRGADDKRALVISLAQIAVAAAIIARCFWRRYFHASAAPYLSGCLLSIEQDQLASILS